MTDIGMKRLLSSTLRLAIKDLRLESYNREGEEVAEYNRYQSITFLKSIRCQCICDYLNIDYKLIELELIRNRELC